MLDRGPRPTPFVISLIAHLSLLATVAFGPRAPATKPQSAYQREIAPHEKKLVWYRFKDKLPDVSPPKRDEAPKPARAELKSPGQTIVSSSPRKDPVKQMTLAPAPEIKMQPELSAPNLMAFEAPKPPPPKRFVAPPQIRRPGGAGGTLEAGPAIPATPMAAIPDPRLPKPAPRPFKPPPVSSKRIEQAALEAGPAIPATPMAPIADPRLPKPAPRAFVPPAQVARKTAARVLEPGAVRLDPQKIDAPALPQPSLPGRPVRAFNAPAPVKRAAPETPLEIPPELASNLTAAVVGLNPMDRPMPEIPKVSRPAEFSAAPETARTVTPGAMASPARVAVPDLTIRGETPAPKRESMATIARVNPTSKENLQSAARPLSESGAAAAPKSSGSMRVSGGPDPRFQGRVVYTVALQMPNVTSYSGSWILWYAERAREAGESPVAAPNPLRKVDPIYDLSAVDDRVEGKVQLSAVIHTDGYVYGISVLSGLDPRLDNSAMTALRKWEFEPARRDGVPVDVDVVIEIPFRLRPRK